jgi:hypothetical protein
MLGKAASGDVVRISILCIKLRDPPYWGWGYVDTYIGVAFGLLHALHAAFRS